MAVGDAGVDRGDAGVYRNDSRVWILCCKFGNYNATYGSLGVVVVLLLWLDLAYVLLLGAELNGELKREAKTINARPTP